MPQNFDIIILGAGAMGSAAAYHLAKKGTRVLALEQFDIPHAQGSSHGHSRMIRLAYHEHPDYVPLLRQAYLLWHQLEAESGQKLIHITGGLYMGTPDCGIIAGSLRSVKQHHLPHEQLSRDDLRRRFGQFYLPENFVGLMDENAGLVLSERAIAAHCELALQRGAEIHGQEPVLNWQATNNSITVRSTRQTYHADHLIICAGAWTGQIVRDLGIPLNITRQVLGWVWPKRPERFALGTLPVWILETPDGRDSYGFPILPENPGFKIADSTRTAPISLDHLSREPTPADEQTFRPALKQFIPDADGPLLSLRICMYTNSPDRQFIIDRHPLHPNVTLACGFSGHGFKFAPVIGQILADLAAEGKTNLPTQFLQLDRFRK